jgi:hypothetical protein
MQATDIIKASELAQATHGNVVDVRSGRENFWTPGGSHKRDIESFHRENYSTEPVEATATAVDSYVFETLHRKFASVSNTADSLSEMCAATLPDVHGDIYGGPLVISTVPVDVNCRNIVVPGDGERAVVTTTCGYMVNVFNQVEDVDGKFTAYIDAVPTNPAFGRSVG